MLIECDNFHKNTVLDYIGNDYSKCLYAYIDICKYGMKSDEVRSFISVTDSINMFFYNYRNGLHIYSKDNILNFDDIKKVLSMVKPKIISSERRIIDFIRNKTTNNFNYEYGFIKKLSNKNLTKSYRVRTANESDISNIANLVFQDTGLTKGFSLEEMKTQISNRMKDNFSRSYILEEDNQIIAHASTGGESDNIAVLNNVIVDSNHRKKGYGFEIVTSLCSDLLHDKEVYLVCYANDAINLYEKIGFQTCENWGKIILD